MRGIKTGRKGSGGPCRRIGLVAPKHPESFWSMQGTVDLLGAKTLMPNSALATLISLTPGGMGVEYVLLDENVSRIDGALPLDLVAITGSTLHAPRIKELCRRFKEYGTSVALGGTFASLRTDQCRGLADHLFIGEAEYTWPRFLEEWSQGRAESVYLQETYVDMKDSPPPDWHLIDSADYLNIPVQTSRGCPNRCDFCDVVQYVGRKYRTKSIDQILREVRNAHAIGANSVFFSDDNFLGDETFTRALLPQVIAWNTDQPHPLSFATQISVQVADDDQLLRLFADARFSVLFLGVETVRKSCLEEVHKSQNLKKDLHRRIRNISKFGVVPFIGLIVGFDHDDAGVFDELHGFLDETSSPIAGISLLNAPENTPLYKRLKNEGRLVKSEFSGEWQLATNIVPKQMSRAELLERYWELFQRIYDPDGFEARLDRWLNQVAYFPDLYRKKKSGWIQFRNMPRLLGHFLFRSDPKIRRLFFGSLKKTWKKDARLLKRAFTLWAQYRHFHDFIDRPLPVEREP